MKNISNAFGIQFNEYKEIYTITHNMYSIYHKKDTNLTIK